MGVHTGEADLAADRYVGLAVHRAARICSVGHGGHVPDASLRCSWSRRELRRIWYIPL
jgi:class 3 adenylate cyclase